MHWPIYALRHARRRPFSKLTKLASHSVCLCGHFVSWTNSIAWAFNKKNLKLVFHIQRACRMTRLSSCGPVAFVHEASLVRPLVLIYNSMCTTLMWSVYCYASDREIAHIIQCIDCLPWCIPYVTLTPNVVHMYNAGLNEVGLKLTILQLYIVH